MPGLRDFVELISGGSSPPNSSENRHSEAKARKAKPEETCCYQSGDGGTPRQWRHPDARPNR